MAFVRRADEVVALEHDDLTAAMIGIGMRFAGPPGADHIDIETTLLAASAQGMDFDDLRILAVLTTWFGVHHPWVNADRLKTLVATASPRVRAFWSSLARWQQADRRFAKLAPLHRGAPLDLLRVGNAFQLRRHGEDARFAGSALRVPATVLRDRAADVQPPEEVARHHRAYRWRLVIGPTIRADAWAALEQAPTLTAADLARRAHCSFATAWHARRDFCAWRAAGGRVGRASPAASS